MTLQDSMKERTKLFIVLFLLLLIPKARAQTQGVALNVGYSYVSTNAGYAGAEYSYRISPSKKWTGFSVGGGTYYGSFNGDFKFIPEGHFSHTIGLLYTEFSATPYNLNPNIGLHFLNGFRVKFGYSWEMGKKDYGMQGLTFGINILLGTKGFYDQFNMSF